MNPGAASTLSVCVRERAACIRIVGRANFTSSVDFKRLVHQLQEDGAREIVLDLRECRLMDSTFLGVLAGLGSKCSAPSENSAAANEQGAANGQKPGCIIELYQPSERVTELLDNLGVLELFRVINDAPPFDCFHPVEDGGASRTEINRTCLDAHRKLMETSPENERRFKDAADYFAKSLRESDGNTGGSGQP